MQTINLRKANALQSEIRKAISSSGVVDTVTITEYTKDIAGGLEKAMADYVTDVTRKVALNTALFNIRKSVSQANANNGISDILADVELIDAKITVYTDVAGKTLAMSFDEINARVEKLKVAPTETARIYGERHNNVSTSVIEQSTVEGAKLIVKQLKRDKQLLQDKLLNLNVNTLINIEVIDEMVLKFEGIL